MNDDGIITTLVREAQLQAEIRELRGRVERAEADAKRAIDENTALLAALNKIYINAILAPSLIALQRVVADEFNSAIGPALAAEKEEPK